MDKIRCNYDVTLAFIVRGDREEEKDEEEWVDKGFFSCQWLM